MFCLHCLHFQLLLFGYIVYVVQWGDTWHGTLCAGVCSTVWYCKKRCCIVWLGIVMYSVAWYGMARILAGCGARSLGVGRLDIGVGGQDDDDEEEQDQDDHDAPCIEFDHLW